MIVLYFLPFYLILGKFDLEKSERAIFAFFIGLGIVPSIVYWLAGFISFRVSIILVWIILMGIGIFIHGKAVTRIFGLNSRK